MTSSGNQLLVYAFGPDARFEGQLVGALERGESAGTLRIVDALLVATDPDTGELVALDLGARDAGGFVEPALSFRLDPARRRRATERALGPHGKAMPGETLRELGRTLQPGWALVALLLEHGSARALEDAVARMSGTLVSDRQVECQGLAELAPDLLAVAEGLSNPRRS